MSKVAIIPLQAFLDAKGDSELVASLAKSVERNATLKAIDALADCYMSLTPRSHAAREALFALRAKIEKGEHDV